MITAREIGAAFGRRAPRNEGQCQIDAAHAPRIRAVRSAAPRVVERTTKVAAVALLMALGGFAVAHAAYPEECRRECEYNVQVCRNTCSMSCNFSGCDFKECLEQCRQVEEDCLGGCR